MWGLGHGAPAPDGSPPNAVKVPCAFALCSASASSRSRCEWLEQSAAQSRSRPAPCVFLRFLPVCSLLTMPSIVVVHSRTMAGEQSISRLISAASRPVLSRWSASLKLQQHAAN